MLFDESSEQDSDQESNEKPSEQPQEKPDLTVPPPEYDALTEGYDPDQRKRIFERKSKNNDD